MRGGVTYEMSSTCVQQGSLHPRPLGGYQPTTMMMEPASAWNYHSVVPKQEPRDEERNNDSGINSGSDFHLSSPGSETSQDLNMQFQSPPQPPPTIYRNINPLLYYQYQQQFGAETAPAEIKTEQTYIDNNNTVTAPESPKASWSNETLPKTPSSTTSSHSDGSEDPLRRLQMTLEKNGLLPPALSPKLSECSGGEDEMKSDNDMDEFDEQGIRIPKVNSHGKVKTFKCKQCDYIAVTKLDFWEHTKGHIKADKLLTCPKCPFVTEYKHHLEYHLRNHFGSKPFKCTQCNYSCVNKSMLNSHLKSHSNIYQYRCADCSYATKYCHSLKLHLRKYQHKPAMVLNPDGTPNPLPIIDVYGTRRGPKVKSQVKQEDDQPTQSSPSPNHPQLSPKPEQLLPFALNQLMMNSSTPQMQLPFPYPFFGGFPGGMPNPLFLQNLERLTRHQRQEDSVEDEEEGEEEANDTGVLDLSKPEAATTKNRRKGRAFKLASMPSDEEIEEDEEMTTTMFSNVEVVQNKSEADEDCSQEKPHLNNNNNKEDYCCQYCTINFGDAVLYTMHMGYHGYKNPFTCNMCGEECKDKVSFFLHIARTPHS